MKHLFLGTINLGRMMLLTSAKYFWVFLFLQSILFHPQPSLAGTFDTVTRCIGAKDAIAVLSPEGQVLLSKNAEQKRTPASILKILTSLVAIHYLGVDYQFKTEFYIDPQSNLKVKGYGDPLLISECLKNIATVLAGKLESVHDIILDDSYFSQPLTIPGVSDSSEPYDAPNGALCANFNTVNFKKDKTGNFISAEPQTPLLPFAIDRIKTPSAYQGRIVLTHRKKDATLYVGHLLAYFLKEEGVRCSGTIKTGTLDITRDRRVYTYISPYTLEGLIAELLQYSNNFIANQILITVGANVYGPPGTLEKGIRAVHAYAQSDLHIDEIEISEGSGISRNNKISANQMIHILEQFKPYAHLLRYENNEYYKTGTLKGVRTRAGYIESKNNELYPFVVLLNTPGKTTHTIMKQLISHLTK